MHALRKDHVSTQQEGDHPQRGPTPRITSADTLSWTFWPLSEINVCHLRHPVYSRSYSSTNWRNSVYLRIKTYLEWNPSYPFGLFPCLVWFWKSSTCGYLHMQFSACLQISIESIYCHYFWMQAKSLPFTFLPLDIECSDCMPWHLYHLKML